MNYYFFSLSASISMLLNPMAVFNLTLLDLASGFNSVDHTYHAFFALLHLVPLNYKSITYSQISTYLTGYFFSVHLFVVPHLPISRCWSLPGSCLGFLLLLTNTHSLGDCIQFFFFFSFLKFS